MARISVEDCLEVVPSRFSLVHVASQRARQLLRGATPMVKSSNRLVVTALREVAEGLVTVEGQELPEGVKEKVEERRALAAKAAEEFAAEAARIAEERRAAEEAEEEEETEEEESSGEETEEEEASEEENEEDEEDED